jgi:hypothetical protein
MLRSLPWIILGGIVLIVGVIITPLLGMYFYLRSPQRVVTGAFEKLLEAKSFSFDLQAEQAEKDSFSLNVGGSLDKRSLVSPISQAEFSFRSGQSFYGNGEVRAKDGQIYLRFDRVVGIPNLLPGALQSMWTGIGVDALLAVGKEKVLPQSTGNMTEEDLQAIKAIVEKHLPIIAVGSGKDAVIDSVPALRYSIGLDRVEALEMISEIEAAAKGAPLSDEERAAAKQAVSALPTFTGDVWVFKSDGRLAACVIVVGRGDQAMHLNMKFFRYDQPVVAEAPINSRPLIELIRRFIGSTLSGVSLKLPFEIPMPILKMEVKMPTVDLPVGGTGAAPENLGELPDLIKLFYGTDHPFSDPLKRK